MQVLVTGGGGYIGSVLVRRLLERGHAVRVLDRLYWGLQPLADCLDHIDLVREDIRDVRPAWFEGMDSVIHLAGLSNDPTANFDPAANWEMNAEATASLAEAARRAGISRFVFGSSCSLYDGLPGDALYDEDAPIAPRGPYAESKRFAEEALLKLSGPDFAPVIMRQGTVYGISPRMRFDLVVNTFVKDVLTSGRIDLHGGGWMWRPLVDVQDAADAQVAALEAPSEQVAGQVFNVVQENYQIRDVAAIIAKALGSQRPIDLNEVPGPAAVRNYRCSNEKLASALGFRPARGVLQAVEEMVAAYGSLSAVDFANPRFYNLPWLQILSEAREMIQPFGYVLRRDESRGE